MHRKSFAFLLVLLGVFGLLPYLQKVIAMSEGYVKTPDSEKASYTVTGISDTNQLVACTSNEIVIKSNSLMSGAMFRCWTNYDAPINLRWELADPSNSLIQSVTTPQAVTLTATDTNQCRWVSMRARNLSKDTTGTVVFRGKSTSATAGFYVEIHFPVTVTVRKNGNTGWTCP